MKLLCDIVNDLNPGVRISSLSSVIVWVRSQDMHTTDPHPTIHAISSVISCNDCLRLSVFIQVLPGNPCWTELYIE